MRHIRRAYFATAAFGQFAFFWSGVLLTLSLAAAVPTVLCSLFLDGFIHACAESFSPSALLLIGPMILAAAVLGIMAQMPPGALGRLLQHFYHFCTIPFDRCPRTGFFRIWYARHTDPALYGVVAGTLLMLALLPGDISTSAHMIGALVGAGLGAATWRAMSGWQTRTFTGVLFRRSGLAGALIVLLCLLLGNGLMIAPLLWAALLLAYGWTIPNRNIR